MTAYRERLKAGIHTHVDKPDELTATQLKAQLKAAGAPTSGSKAELAERLEQQQHDDGTDDS